MPDEEIERFWVGAVSHARISKLPGYLPPTSLSVLTPPAWSFGSTPAQADALLALVLDGRKTATASDPAAYDEDEPRPQTGTLGIILDGSGRPRVLVEVTDVEVVPFDQVGEEHARLEGEGDLSLAHWRAAHRAFFGAGFREDMPVILERFRVLHRG